MASFTPTVSREAQEKKAAFIAHTHTQIYGYTSSNSLSYALVQGR